MKGVINHVEPCRPSYLSAHDLALDRVSYSFRVSLANSLTTELNDLLQLQLLIEPLLPVYHFMPSTTVMLDYHYNYNQQVLN